MRFISRLSVVTVGAVTLTLCAAGIARGDWDPGEYHKMHYPQLPDLTPTGLDVLATYDPTSTGPQGPLWKTLADDFLCTQSGPISDIHFWGSWLNDQVFTGVQFKLSIHADIPATPTSFSRPAFPPLWERVVTPTNQRLYSTLPPPLPPEQFYNPNTGQIMGTDRQIWQYNFTDIVDPFIQEAGRIYWLDVQAIIPSGIPVLFGWKTTNPTETPHFNDDAVYWDTILPGPGQLPIEGPLELVYPAGHPYAGQSMDLAFVITPEPGTSLFLLGGLIGLGISRRRQ
jgi:hypothetical protein